MQNVTDSPRWDMLSLTTEALIPLHLRRRVCLLHIHEGSLRDPQSMSVSSSTFREAILYTRCLAGTTTISTHTQQRTCKLGHSCPPYSSVPCLPFRFWLGPYQTCGVVYVNITLQQVSRTNNTPFTSTLLWCPSAIQCL